MPLSTRPEQLSYNISSVIQNMSTLLEMPHYDALKDFNVSALLIYVFRIQTVDFRILNNVLLDGEFKLKFILHFFCS